MAAAVLRETSPPCGGVQDDVVTSVRVQIARRGEFIDDAANIWARATTARDGGGRISPLSVSRPIIQGAAYRRMMGLRETEHNPAPTLAQCSKPTMSATNATSG